MMTACLVLQLQLHVYSVYFSISCLLIKCYAIYMYICSSNNDNSIILSCIYAGEMEHHPSARNPPKDAPEWTTDAGMCTEINIVINPQCMHEGYGLW